MKNEKLAMKRRANRYLDVFARFLHDRSGATAIEYTLIVSIICIGMLASAGTLGSAVDRLYTKVADDVANAME